MEVGARGHALARGRQHGLVFSNCKLLCELLAAIELARPHLEDEIGENGAARVEERLDDNLRAVDEDDVQRLILAVVVEDDLFVGDRREVDLDSPSEAGVENICLSGLRFDELDHLNRSDARSAAIRLRDNKRTVHETFPRVFSDHARGPDAFLSR